MKILPAAIIAVLLAVSCTAGPEKPGIRTTDGYIVAAYVWPSCHDDGRPAF